MDPVTLARIIAILDDYDMKKHFQSAPRNLTCVNEEEKKQENEDIVIQHESQNEFKVKEPPSQSIDSLQVEGHPLVVNSESEATPPLEQNEGYDEKVHEEEGLIPNLGLTIEAPTIVAPAEALLSSDSGHLFGDEDIEKSQVEGNAFTLSSRRLPPLAIDSYFRFCFNFALQQFVLFPPPEPPDGIVASTLSHSLINFYAKCEHYTYAQQMLDEMPEQDVVSFLQQHSLLSSILFPPVSSRASPSSVYLLSSSEMRKTPTTLPPPKPPDAATDVPEIYRFAAKTKGVFINPALVEPFGLTLIEASAHGLPMVATKNGGPVDIHRALNNGLLVDPHDHKAIADALLKLLSEKNLWHECRKNGWKNIHLFSWPEYCRTYLTRVAACRMRYPQWQNDTPEDDVADEESFNDSLKDVQDMSLRLSIDGDLAAASGLGDVQDQVKRLLSKIRKSSDSGSNSNSENLLLDNVANKFPLLRRRRRLIVIALDSYDSNGDPDKKLIEIVQRIIKAVQLDPITARVSGFALSTAMTMQETVEFLSSGNIQVNEFDAIICSSGSEVYYPGVNSEEGKLLPDPDYELHIDYRWGVEGLKNTICKLMNASEGGEGSEKSSSPIEEDVKSSNAHCIAYKLKDLSKAKKVDDLRQKLRMRGLRCHPMYCKGSSRIHVIPLLASRAQALRYLFVRWRLNVANMYVILGESGDTDYEEMISGTHKTIIIKGVVSKVSEELLRGPGSYQRDDVVPNESPLVAYITETTEETIANALKQLSKSG